MGRRLRAFVYATFLTAALLKANALSSQQVGRAAVEVRIPTPPTLLFALGRWQMVYELHLTNFGAKPLDLIQIDALDSAGVALGSWRGQSLAQRVALVGELTSGGPRNPLDALKQAPGSRSIAYIWITLQPGYKAPATIHHRLIFGTVDSSYTILTANTKIDSRESPSLVAPVSEGPWAAIRGPANSSGHRISIVTLDGEAAIPQRFAIDWAKLGPDGRLFRGDSTVLKNWYGYGTPVAAVAAGTVAWTKTDAAEHLAMTLVAPDIIDATEALGNAVILDIGNGRYATYAHLKPGSIRVKAGDTVTLGQAIAELGNSGNSLGPHLHFHVSDSPKPLGGEGLPYTLPSFELVGRILSSASLLSGAPWTANAAQPARSVSREMPLENMVVRFIR